MGKKASRKDVEAANPQAGWLSEPEDQAMLARIIDLLFAALNAEGIWEAMEYVMGARALSKILKEAPRCLS